MTYKDSEIIGVSDNLKKIHELITHIADTGLNVVIYGETGVGKELIANKLYASSPRNGKPFIKVNCAALPEGLLESELFGFEPGAFTGANRKRRGKFELAHEGVLFLDEIGDMSLNLQAKLLHVLQTGEFSPLGSEKSISTNNWVISATNQNLEKCLEKQIFREDLYYRLNTIKIHILPLRERSEDIVHLINYYIEKYNREFDKKEIEKPNGEIMDALMSYKWPGNVRELQNVLKQRLVLGSWEEIVEDLDNKNTKKARGPAGNGAGSNFSVVNHCMGMEKNDIIHQSSFSLKKITKKVAQHAEKEIIACVLEKTGWNRTKAAKLLDISYKTLLYKIENLDIIPPRHR